MLQTFRVIINSLVGKVFFAILVLTFGLLGVGYGFRDLLLGATTRDDAAVVGGTKITLNELEREFRRGLQNYEQQTRTYNPTAQQKQALAQQTLDQAIDNALFANEANEAGFRVGDGLVRDIIEHEPAFAGENKRFDKSRFRALLDSQNLTEGAFIPQVRASMTRQLLMNPIANSATAPKFLVDEIYRYRNEQRVAQTVTIPNTAAAGIAAPTDAEVDTYYKAHTAEFTAPEYRAFTVLSVTPDLLTGEIKPTDDDLHAAYDQRKAEFIDPEKRKVTQLTVNDEATAAAVAKAMEGGKSMADAAKAATGGKVQPVALDFLTKDVFPESLREPVFAASKGAPVGPIKSILGWHVVQVDDIQQGHQVPFDEVKGKLADQFKRDKAIDDLSQKIDRMGDRLTAGASMDEVGSTVGAKPVKFGPADDKGQMADADAAKGAKPEATWLATAFQTPQGETSSFQDDKNGGFYAVKVDQVKPPALRPLADVRAQIVADWTKEQQAVQVAKKAAELAAKAKSGTALDQIAKESGGKLDTTAPLIRDPAQKQAAPALADALFKLEKVGDIAAVQTDDGQVIAKLTEIRPANPSGAGEKLRPITVELDSSMREDALTEYRNGLRQDIKIKINPEAVQSVAGQ